MDPADPWPGPPELRGGLLDQYGRGVLHGELGLGTFEAQLAAVAGFRGGTPPRGCTFYDSGPGRAVLRWCPPLLGLDPHCPPARYLARRRELGAYAASRALLRGSGIDGFLVDVPATEAGTTSAAELAAAGQGGAWEAVSLVALAGQVADTSGTVGAFLANTAAAVHTAGRDAAAFISGAGFHEAEAPGAGEVRLAAGRWLRARAAAARGAGTWELREPALVRHLLWAAATTGRPVQLHCGAPGRLSGFLKATAGRGVRLVLLPEAGYEVDCARLAAAFAHVWADVGPEPGRTLGEAPSGKLLFSSRAGVLPELYVVAARRHTAGMRRVLGEWVADGVCSRAGAARIAADVAATNACRLYGLAQQARPALEDRGAGGGASEWTGRVGAAGAQSRPPP